MQIKAGIVPVRPKIRNKAGIPFRVSPLATAVAPSGTRVMGAEWLRRQWGRGADGGGARHETALGWQPRRRVRPEVRQGADVWQWRACERRQRRCVALQECAVQRRHEAVALGARIGPAPSTAARCAKAEWQAHDVTVRTHQARRAPW